MPRVLIAAAKEIYSPRHMEAGERSGYKPGFSSRLD